MNRWICFWLCVAPIWAMSQEADRVQAVYFSDQESIEDRLIEWIDKETQSIRMAAYCVMNTKIGKALQRAHARGVDVEILVDPYSVKSRSPLKKLVAAGIPVYVWNPEVGIGKKKGLMHHKFCVLGGHRVWTGSFNFTKEASINNRENVVLIQGSQAVSNFLQQFNHLKKEGGCLYAEFVRIKNG